MRKLLVLLLVALLFTSCGEPQESQTNSPVLGEEDVIEYDIIEEPEEEFEFVYVDSSALLKVAYKYNAEELAVVFHTSPTTVYTYEGVSNELYEEFMSSESLGRFYNQYFKGQYPGQKIENYDF